jgi:hypothetical protein
VRFKQCKFDKLPSDVRRRFIAAFKLDGAGKLEKAMIDGWLVIAGKSHVAAMNRSDDWYIHTRRA